MDKTTVAKKAGDSHARSGRLPHFDDYDYEAAYQDELHRGQVHIAPDIRCAYKTQYTRAGKIMEVKVFTSFPDRATFSRARKAAKTRTAQQKANARRAEQKFTLLVNHNFGTGDLYLTLTYNDDELPPDLETAKRDIVNYIARVKYHCKKSGIPCPEYIYVIENADSVGPDALPYRESGRIHFHVFMHTCLDPKTLMELWGKGERSEVKTLNDAQEGLVGIALYTAKGPKFSQLWRGSKGLKKPVTRESYALFRKSEVVRMAQDQERMKEMFERKFPGYRYSDDYPCRVSVNPVIGGYYLYVRLYVQDGVPEAWPPKGGVKRITC